ncbi:hypothetical protein ACQKC5_01960 [Shewanella baltica]|uniref:hypothetical protein n=1 Tax=Shewanella baltica TaxID=62322 RepID=UPI003D02B1D7
MSPENTDTFKRSTWWKIYFFFITILTATGMISMLSDPSAGAAEYIYLSLWVVGTVGFFGFVFLKPIYKPQFWLTFLVGYIVLTITYYFLTNIDQRMGMSDNEYYITTAISWLISLPAYYALYAYGNPRNPAWKNA